MLIAAVFLFSFIATVYCSFEVNYRNRVTWKHFFLLFLVLILAVGVMVVKHEPEPAKAPVTNCK